MIIMEILFNKFPREFASPKRTFIQNKDDFVFSINRFNGLKNCYSTIYPMIERRCYGGNDIDKLFFDLDEPRTCWNATIKMHNKLEELDYKHVVLHSGGGFHIYVFLEVESLNNPKPAIYKGQHHIANLCGVSIGKPKKADIDEHVIGDIARIARIPNTWNIKRRRYCIYILEEDFDKSFDSIKLIAKKQRYKKQIFGSKLFNIKEWDSDIQFKTYDGSSIDLIDVGMDDMNVDTLFYLMPPIVKKSLLDGKDGLQDRYFQILMARDSGITKNMAIKLFKKYWSEKKFNHAMFEENQINYLYDRFNLCVPNWETLERQGYTITKEDRDFKFYK